MHLPDQRSGVRGGSLTIGFGGGISSCRAATNRRSSRSFFMKCAREDCLNDARWAPLLHVPVDEETVEPLTWLVRLPLCERHLESAQAGVLLDDHAREELTRRARARGLTPDFERTWITPVEVEDPDQQAGTTTSESKTSG